MKYDIRPDESVSSAVVAAVRHLEGRDAATLDPLEETVDRAALDAIFAQQTDGKPRGSGRVSFIFSHSRVTVDNNEYIEVTAAA